jgi:carboxylesterase type B
LLISPQVAGYFRPQPLPNDTVSTLISLYPTAPELGCPYNTGNIKLSSGALDKQACSIFGDLVQVGPARMIATALANDGVPTYRYRFNQLSYNVSSVAKGITTGAEEIYVFSNLIPNIPWDQTLAYEMTSAWVSFAHDLNPNPGTSKLIQPM